MLGSNSGFCLLMSIKLLIYKMGTQYLPCRNVMIYTKLLAVPGTYREPNEMIVVLIKVFSSILFQKIIGDYLFLIALVRMRGTAQWWLRA